MKRTISIGLGISVFAGAFALDAAAGEFCKTSKANAVTPIDPLKETSAENKLAEKFAPIIYLADGEEYYPAKVEDYFLDSTTDFRNGSTTIKAKGRVTMQAIYDRFKANGR